MDRYQKFISEKAKKKRELLGKMFFPRTPVVMLDFSEAKNVKKYKKLIEGLAEIKVTTLVVSGPTSAVEDYSGNIHYIEPDREKEAREAADFVVLLNSNVAKILKNGCVPVALLNGDSTVNYNPLQEKGNGFYFKNPTVWEIFAAIVRALETYQFPYDWENLIKEILKEDGQKMD